MDIRKVKLNLTVALMNLESKTNILSFIKDVMLTFKEVGSFLGLAEVSKASLNHSNTKKTYSIQFENCVLDVDLVSNRSTKTQVVHGFNLR